MKLADFGVATKLTEADVNTHSVVGTPYWMAPEVLLSFFEMKDTFIGNSFPLIKIPKLSLKNIKESWLLLSKKNLLILTKPTQTDWHDHAWGKCKMSNEFCFLQHAESVLTKSMNHALDSVMNL